MKSLVEFEPWPIDALVNRLQSGDLEGLVAPRQATTKHDVRENLLEEQACSVMIETFGQRSVSLRKQAKMVLGHPDAPFPGGAQPDISLRHGGLVHFCELKSNRVDYGRFDNVFESKPFRTFLQSIGDGDAVPWEVEQDLIKLHQYKSLAPTVGSCLFLLIDAYRGSGLTWSQVFQSRAFFLETMRTRFIRALAEQLLAATRIVPMRAPNASANLILTLVHSWSDR